MQELSLIRPLRILSPEGFKEGPSTSPVTHNSCPTKWSPPVNMDGSESNVQCVGIKAPIGTGPWKVGAATKRTDDTISEMQCLKNADWWGARGNIEEKIISSRFWF